MQVRKTVLLVLRSWSPKLAKNFTGLGMLIRPAQVTPRSTNNSNRRGKPSVPTQPDRHPSPSQWQATQANVGYPAIQQVYTAHTPSFLIPVPIPSARHATPAHYPRHQVVAALPMAVHTHAAVQFGAHSVALQSQFRSAASR